MSNDAPGTTHEVLVDCPDCSWPPACNRADRRAQERRSRSCSMCGGSGTVYKSLPGPALVDEATE